MGLHRLKPSRKGKKARARAGKLSKRGASRSFRMVPQSLHSGLAQLRLVFDGWAWVDSMVHLGQLST